MAQIHVAIAVTDDALPRLMEVIQACRDLGFRADSTLSGVGIVTGFIDARALDALRALPGVAAVELENDIRIRPSPRFWSGEG
jgi:hypothetical protein